MLTSYLVKCPHPGCDWYGSLLPRHDSLSWRNLTPAKSIVEFQCPQCQGEWRARVVGDDVKALPLEEVVVSGA
jgi:hypothetical protein